MFYRYEVRKKDQEEILYLYLTMNYEFSKELDNQNNTNIKKEINKFIQNNSIDFKGNKIYLVVDGIIIKSIDIEKNNTTKDTTTDTDYSNDRYMINLVDNEKNTSQITLKQYLLGTLATNTIDDLELTTLKALCILYRTYAYKEMKEKKMVKADNEFCIYKKISYFKLLWVDQYYDNYHKIEKAINDTNGEFATYQNDYIYPFIHICNNGLTSTKKDFPYLEKRYSIWDYSSPHYLDIKDYSYDYLKQVLNIEPEKFRELKIDSVNEGKHINKITIGEKTFTGEQFRNLLELKSSDINIIINPTTIKFITKGWGHNLGISQYGANEIAKTGCSYLSILKYYFPKVEIKKYKNK